MLAGALLAPSVVIALDIAQNVTYFLSAEGHAAKYFSGPVYGTALAAYLGSAVVGALATMLRIAIRAPLRTWVVASSWVSSAAALCLFIPAGGFTRLYLGVVLVVGSLAISLTYCAIAGVPWRGVGLGGGRVGADDGYEIHLPGRWRRMIFAALAAPATLVALDLIRNVTYFLSAPEHPAKYFPNLFLFAVMCAYAGSAAVGGLASALRATTKAPLRAWVVVMSFALSAGIVAQFVPGPWYVRLTLALTLAAASLPVSLTYCAIAGVPWRRAAP